MKLLKFKSFKNSLVSIILCILLTFSCVLFSSCTIDDEDDSGETFFEQYIDSFKVVYANSLEGDKSNIDDLTDELTGAVIIDLLYYYAYGDVSVDNASVFPDDIRMFVYSNKETRAEIEDYYPKIDLNYRWKWTLNNNLDGNEIDSLKPNLEDPEETYDKWINKILGEFGIKKNYYRFLDIYFYPLQTILYEIMLGYELTTFDIDYQGSDGSTVVTIRNCPSNTSLNGQEVSEDNTIFMGYIKNLLSKYQKVTKYIGFTKENADKMISYILDNVIGTDLVNYDYLTYGPSNQNSTHIKNIEQYASGFKTILGIEDDNEFSTYVSKLRDGDIIYNPIGYNYLIYRGTDGTGSSKKYYFEEYYNYRNYIERVANIIYGQTYDGSSKVFEYSRDVMFGTTKVATVSYDYVKAMGVEVSTGNLSPKQFSARAATFLKNFEGETFFQDVSEEGDSNAYTFGDSPKAEYQSILLVPNSKNTFVLEAGMAFDILAYDQNLKINIKVRYYYYNASNNTGMLFEFDAGQTSFVGSETMFDPRANTYGYQSDFETGFDLDVLPSEAKTVSNDARKYEQFIITPFSDESAKNALGSDKEINLGEDKNASASSYYKVINSQNGYGGLTVLDESKIKCSFYEIVFDVVKSPQDPANMDYDFKIALSMVI